MLILKTLSVILLLAMLVDDVRHHKIWQWLFPMLAITLGMLTWVKQGYFDFYRVFINVIVLAIMLGLLILWLSLKHRRLVNITNGLLCWGDILFLLCVAFYLPLYSYLIFYVASLIGTLLYGLIIQMIKHRQSDWRKQKIPLAGFQAGFLALILVVGWLHPAWDISNDDTVLLALYPLLHNVNGGMILL